MEGWPPKRECPHCHNRERVAIWSERQDYWYCTGCKRRWSEIFVIPQWMPPTADGQVCLVVEEDVPDPPLHIFNEWRRRYRVVPVVPRKPPPFHYRAISVWPRDKRECEDYEDWRETPGVLG